MTALLRVIAETLGFLAVVTLILIFVVAAGAEMARLIRALLERRIARAILRNRPAFLLAHGMAQMNRHRRLAG